MTLYDRNGMPAAYIDSDREHIYLFDGRPAAYLYEDAVYGFEGAQYGWFEKGWVRDLDGYCVMFTDEARTQGPAKPRAARPTRRSRETKRSKTAYKAAWSEIAAGDFLSGNS